VSVYSYVILATAGTFFLGFWHGVRVGFFRKAAGINYPRPYADSGDMSGADNGEKKKAMYLCKFENWRGIRRLRWGSRKRSS